MALHKTISIATGANYQDTPEKIVFAASGYVNISAFGNGRSVGNNGVRWWDSSVVTSNGTVSGVAGQEIVLPFTKNFLPNFLNDHIVQVSIDGALYVYATSNSPANQVATVPSSPANVFWIDLLAIGFNGGIGDNSASNNYMNGGIIAGSVPGGAGGTLVNAKIRLLDPPAAPGSFTVTVRYVAYDGSHIGFNPYVKTVNYLAAQQVIPAVDSTAMYSHYGLQSYDFVAKKGFFEVTVAHTLPQFRSLLNIYHWGLSN